MCLILNGSLVFINDGSEDYFRFKSDHRLWRTKNDFEQNLAIKKIIANR